MLRPLLIALAMWPLATRCFAQAVVELPVTTNVPASVELPLPYDEAALRDPVGYNFHGKQRIHFAQRLIIENRSTTHLHDPEVVVNGEDWRTPGALAVSEDASPEARARHLFRWWTQHRSHAATGLKAAEEPTQMLRFWGYTLCGEDTRALSRLLAPVGFAARSVPLNGHVAGEYQTPGGQWQLLDGDQNIAYLGWDNRTLVGYEELRADPLLAQRTKPFGRYAPRTRAFAQFNTGLFEYVAPAVPKPIREKAKDQPVALGEDVLHAGETLILHLAQAPETPAGNPAGAEWQRARPAALRMAEWRVVPKARSCTGGELKLTSAFPILAVKNLDTGVEVPIAKDQVVFACTVPVRSGDDRVVLWQQRARNVMPHFRHGPNSLVVAAKESAPLTVRLEHADPATLPAQPAPPAVTPPMADGAGLRLPAQAGAQDKRIWWQIAAEPSFAFVAPSLEQIEPVRAGGIQLDGLAASFLNPATAYYVRAKVAGAGVWSEWSVPVRFEVARPAPPQNLSATALPDGKVRLAWTGAADEFVIYASNRLDFVPELYTTEEITAMRDHAVTGSRPNRNLLGQTRDAQYEFVPAARYYRVLARRGEQWSVPSVLFKLPPELAAKLPPPTVFQIRWTATTGLDGVKRDEYIGAELPLP